MKGTRKQSPWVALAPCAILLLSFGLSCGRPSRQSGQGQKEATRILRDTLEGRLLSTAPAIGQPVHLRLVGPYLWVTDGHSDPGLHVLNAETGELILSVGRRGEGPGDFRRYPLSLHSRPNDGDGVWAWDPSLQRLTRFEPRPPAEYDFEVLTLSGQENLLRMVWLDSGEMIGTAYSERNRFQVFSRSGEYLRSIPGKLLGPPTAPVSERLKATASGVVVQPWPGHGFVAANMVSSRIEYYDENANLVRLADVPDPWGPVFEERPNGDLYLNNMRSAYRSCSTAGDYLFALYSGRPESIDERAWARSADVVHVFDWQGNLRASFQMDRDVNWITVNPSGTILYASSLFDSHIYQYSLPVIGEG